MKYIKHIEIDKLKWDKCIEQSVNGLVYANSWYLDITCENWDAIILNDYEAVMPLPWKSKFGIKYIYHPFFSQQLGVFYKDNCLINIDSFINSIPKNFLKYEFALNYKNQNASILLDPRANYLLSLNKSHNDIIKAYDVKCRRNVKLSKKEDVTLNKLLSVDTFLDFKKQNMINSVSEAHFRIMNNLLTFLISNNRAQIIGAYDNDNSLLGSAVFVFYKKRIVYLFSVSTFEGKKKRVMYKILDHVIEENSNKDLHLDFEGSMIDSIARFFKSFNADSETYYRISKSKIPFIK